MYSFILGAIAGHFTVIGYYVIRYAFTKRD